MNVGLAVARQGRILFSPTACMASASDVGDELGPKDIGALAQTFVSQSILSMTLHNDTVLAADLLRKLPSEFPGMEPETTTCCQAILDGASPSVALRALFEEMRVPFPEIIGHVLAASEIPGVSPREIRDQDRVAVKLFQTAQLPPPQMTFEECIEFLGSRATDKQRYGLYAFSMELGYTFVNRWRDVARLFASTARKEKITLQRGEPDPDAVLDNNDLHALNIVCRMVATQDVDDSVASVTMEIVLGMLISQSPRGWILSSIAIMFGCAFHSSETTFPDKARVSANVEDIFRAMAMVFSAGVVLIGLKSLFFQGAYIEILTLLSGAFVWASTTALRRVTSSSRAQIAIVVGSVTLLAIYLMSSRDPEVQQQLSVWDNLFTFAQNNGPSKFTKKGEILQIPEDVDIIAQYAKLGVGFHTEDNQVCISFNSFNDQRANCYDTVQLAQDAFERHAREVVTVAKQSIMRARGLLARSLEIVPPMLPCVWRSAFRLVRTGVRICYYQYRNYFRRANPASLEDALVASSAFITEVREYDSTVIDDPGESKHFMMKLIRDNLNFLPVGHGLRQGRIGDYPNIIPARAVELSHHFFSPALITTTTSLRRSDAYRSPEGSGWALVRTRKNMDVITALFQKHDREIDGILGRLRVPPELDSTELRLFFQDCLRCVDMASEASPLDETSRCLLALILMWCGVQAYDNLPLMTTEKFLVYIDYGVEGTSVIHSFVGGGAPPDVLANYALLLTEAIKQIKDILIESKAYSTATRKSSTEFSPAHSIRPEMKQTVDRGQLLQFGAGALVSMAGPAAVVPVVAVASGASRMYAWATEKAPATAGALMLQATGDAGLTALMVGSSILLTTAFDVMVDSVVNFLESKYCGNLPVTDVSATMDAMLMHEWFAGARLLSAATAAVWYRDPLVNSGGTISYVASSAAFTHYALNIAPIEIMAIDSALHVVAMAGEAALQKVAVFSLDKGSYRDLFPLRYTAKTLPIAAPGLAYGDLRQRLDDYGRLSQAALEIVARYRQVDELAFVKIGVMTLPNVLAYVNATDESVLNGLGIGYTAQQIALLFRRCLAFDHIPDAQRLVLFFLRHHAAIGETQDWIGTALQNPPYLFIGPKASILFAKVFGRVSSPYITCQDVARMAPSHREWDNESSEVRKLLNHARYFSQDILESNIR